MGIEKFVIFDTVSDVKPKLKSSPKGNARLSKLMGDDNNEPIDEKPKKQALVEISNNDEDTILASKSEREDTIQVLKKMFDKEEKLGKHVVDSSFMNHKTILGNSIESSDKLISVLEIIPGTILDCPFISVSPRLVVERELNTLSKKYVSVNPNRKIPVLVKAKYMSMEHCPKHRDIILDQFM